MKKIIARRIVLLHIMILLCGLSYSQIISVNVNYVQNFEHPIMNTNKAINENKVIYKDGGQTNSMYIFDFEKMILTRQMDGQYEQFEIIEKLKDPNGLLNVYVKFSDVILANYIYEPIDDQNKLFLCRWKEGNKIRGWFDRTIK